MTNSSTNDFTGNSIRDSLAFQSLKGILLFGAISALIAAVVVFLVFTQSVIELTVCLVLLASLFSFIRYYVLDRIQSETQVDIVAAIIFCSAVTANFLGTTTPDHDSPINTGFMIMLGGFAFFFHSSYFGFVAFAVLGHIMVRLGFGHELGGEHVSLLVLAPVYSILTRMGIEYLKASNRTARTAVLEKIEQLEQEKELRLESERQFVQAQKMEGLGLLAAGVAHDFNNHLQSIRIFSELIQQSPHSSEQYANYIQQSTENAAEICQRMLAYAGRTQEKFVSVNLQESLAHMKPILDAGISKDATLAFELGDGCDFVDANESELQQCITNIVNNAVDAVPEHSGRIEVAILPERDFRSGTDQWRVFGDEKVLDGKFVCIHIIDNGCGMDAETLDCSFDPYFTTKRSGHGFGLATTLGIVRSMEGMIRCKTAVGVGTSMQLILPISKKLPAGQSLQSIESKFSAKRILLVDDDDLVRTGIQNSLEAAGLEVVSARSSQDALAIVRDMPDDFDLYLIDYSMPEMSGIELFEELRELGKSNPIIICSGYARESVLSRNGLKPDAFIAKPFGLGEIQSLLS